MLARKGGQNSWPLHALGESVSIPVQVTIDEKEVVSDAKRALPSGDPALQLAALEAARACRFAPGLKRHYVAVATRMMLPFRFSRRT
jgi:TonB family protein